MNYQERIAQGTADTRVTFVVVLACIYGLTAAQGQIFGIYGGPNTGVQGISPQRVTLIQAVDGNFYGTMSGGGPEQKTCKNYVGCGGVAFKLAPSGTGYSILYTFCSLGDGNGNCPDGRTPYAGLLQANDGNFYGTTYAGGTYNDGTIFRLTPAGTLTTLHNFCWSPNNCSQFGVKDDGAGPVGQLIQASNGALYGATNAGTLFKITIKGKFTLLGNEYPSLNGINASLIQVGSGLIYGAAGTGGAHGVGAIFSMTLAGKIKVLYSFCPGGPPCQDGDDPEGALALGSDGNLYGTTAGAGANGVGTVFKITPKGKLTTLHTFANDGNDGNGPIGPMLLATDGNLYGTTNNGGYTYSVGTIYEISPSGEYDKTTWFDDTGSTCSGTHPQGGLLQSTNGNFYGIDPGSQPCSTGFEIYEYNIGLGAFVQPIPAFGKVGAKVIIQGTDLTGASSVTFNGQAAAFNVVSATEITTTVPAGAATGTLQVTTPSGTLNSNVQFTVK